MSSYFSICIPAYEMHGKGCEYLSYLLHTISIQSFKDYEIIVSDHSINDNIKSICACSALAEKIKYFRYEQDRGNSPSNVNNCLNRATGEVIKIMFQDDSFCGSEALADIKRVFDSNVVQWSLSSFYRTDSKSNTFGEYTPIMQTVGNGILYFVDHMNTIGSPSVMAYRNNNLRFDTNLVMCMDIDFYYRMGIASVPCILTRPMIGVREWENCISAIVDRSQGISNVVQKEKQYLVNKYAVK